MELEEAIRRVLSFQTEYVDRTIVDEEELEETDLNNYAINMVIYTLETSIPRAVVEEAKAYIEYYAMNNFALTDFNLREKAFRHILELLNKGE